MMTEAKNLEGKPEQAEGQDSAQAGERNPPERPPKIVRDRPFLEKWSVVIGEVEDLPYVPDQAVSCRLRGEIHGHPNPKFQEGMIISTSQITSLDTAARKASTKNTTYDLGDPDPAFLKWLGAKGIKLESYDFVTTEPLRKKRRSL